MSRITGKSRDGGIQHENAGNLTVVDITAEYKSIHSIFSRFNKNEQSFLRFRPQIRLPEPRRKLHEIQGHFSIKVTRWEWFLATIIRICLTELIAAESRSHRTYWIVLF